MPEGVVLFGTDGRIEVLNQRFFALCNLPDAPAEWRGRALAELLAHVQPQVLARVPHEGGETLPLRSGRVVASSTQPEPATTGRPARQLLCLTDETDATQRFQLLAELEAVARIPQQNPYPVLRLAASGRQLYANSAARQLGLGLAPAERISWQRALAAQALAQCTPSKEEGALGQRWFSVHAEPFVAEGNINLYVFETTARVRAEQQLQEQQRFYETILNELPAEVFVVDHQYRYRFVNPAAVPDAELRQWILGVLLVEDNEINREVARFMLEEWGVILEEAVDGEKGLRLLTDHVYDVVLMDIQMPGLSGVEVTRAVRQLPDPVRAQVPILALTANAFREDNERYRAAGMNDCLAKPFEEEALYHKLNALRAAHHAPLRPHQAACHGPRPRSVCNQNHPLFPGQYASQPAPDAGCCMGRAVGKSSRAHPPRQAQLGGVGSGRSSECGNHSGKSPQLRPGHR
ncbi:hypothetical protein AUC43_05780 [Hymenobacter sedentarius]|uniref:Response regulatory domain-containing protein n=1 Tax=Hymenobacter sedentarius TaxID=1411621 RepID=A0A0U4C932_9BACT|nr:hypothetical protein AUC43_05780 [Hymenobacter sedentarius]